MAEYHNILTQVQVRGPAEMGLDERGLVAKERGVEPRFSSILGYVGNAQLGPCLLYTSPSPRDGLLSRMPSSA